MFVSMMSTYFVLKVFYFYSLVRVQIKFEPMQERWLLLASLYTGGVAFLSFIFLSSLPALTWSPWLVQLGNLAGVSPWAAWVAVTFALASIYFFLMSRFDEGVIFWTLLLLGLPLVFF